MTSNRFTARDVMNETGVSSSAVYRYLAQWEASHPNTNIRDEDNRWSMNTSQFRWVVSFINRQTQSVTV